MGRLTLATLLLTSLTGCAPSLLAAHREHVAQATSERVPLRLRVVGGDMRVVVSGRLGDAPVTWAINTGAGDHSGRAPPVAPR